ncbi:unnamed protein product, partial [Iphiclides podalirius]
MIRREKRVDGRHRFFVQLLVAGNPGARDEMTPEEERFPGKRIGLCGRRCNLRGVVAAPPSPRGGDEAARYICIAVRNNIVANLALTGETAIVEILRSRYGPLVPLSIIQKPRGQQASDGIADRCLSH